MSGLVIRSIHGCRCVQNFLDSLQPKLENLPSAVRLAPRIDSVKEAVVAPDSFPELLVNADEVRRFSPSLEVLCGMVEFAIFRGPTTRQKFGLIEQFGGWAYLASGDDCGPHKSERSHHLAPHLDTGR